MAYARTIEGEMRLTWGNDKGENVEYKLTEAGMDLPDDLVKSIASHVNVTTERADAAARASAAESESAKRRAEAANRPGK